MAGAAEETSDAISVIRRFGLTFEKVNNDRLEQARLVTEEEDKQQVVQNDTQQSGDKVCAVCLDIVVDKDEPLKRRFGILPGCSHCVCVDCIREWTQQDFYQTCPVCRIVYPFYIPSASWVDDTQDKLTLIAEHKDRLSHLPCVSLRDSNICLDGPFCWFSHECVGQDKHVTTLNIEDQSATIAVAKC